MPRTKRVAPGGMVFQALNRGVGRMRIFLMERDYLAFEATVEETLARSDAGAGVLPAARSLALRIVAAERW